MIPLKYNVRNLRVRWVNTLMTVIGTGLVVWVTVLTFGLTGGLEHALMIGGNPRDIIVLRKGSTDETGSVIDSQTARDVATLPGVETTSDGVALCSIEFATILTKPRRGDGGTTNLIVRGIERVGRLLRPDFTIVEGRDFEDGVKEAITSRRMAERFQNLAIGESLEINQVEFKIVGYFEAGGSAAESEVWTSLGDLTDARQQLGAVSSVSVRAADDAAMAKLMKQIQEDDQFNLKAIEETEYFAEQMTASIAVKLFGSVIAGFLTIGAMFAAANTMFSAVATRSREIGTLRALGFRRRSILFSFMMESVILCLLGGLLGCLATLPLHGLSTGTANWATFSEITFSFRFAPDVLARGVLMALVMGVLGGLFPAVRAMRMEIVKALRET